MRVPHDDALLDVAQIPTGREQRVNRGAIEKTFRLAADRIVIRLDRWMTARAIVHVVRRIHATEQDAAQAAQRIREEYRTASATLLKREKGMTMSIGNTVRYTELTATRFRDLWR